MTVYCYHEGCGQIVDTTYFKEGSGFCNHCKRILQFKTNHIELPRVGRLISTFAEEVAAEIKDKNNLFYRIDSKEIVEIGTIKLNESEQETYTGFLSIKPNRFITMIEKNITPVIMLKNKKTDEIEAREKSISSELANTLLCSEILQKSLPQIQRIFTIPIPIMYKDELTFPCKGYDARFNSWLPYDAPEIENPNMSLQEAKDLFKTIFHEFCFKDQQDYVNAVSALLTPYLRGIFTKFNTRTPVFFYLANRERAGKDYLAGVTGLVYEGNNIEEPPLSSGEKGAGSNSEELRKKFLAALLSGRKRMHFSNNKGYIDNAVFESITTAEEYTDRILGRSENATFENEIDFSLSGNVGVTFTPDFANRCRFINLFLEIENANERKFEISDLHGYVLMNRPKILSALYALVRNWKEKGCPAGSLPFASYHQWAKICGGVMEAAGYGNPCAIDKELVTVSGDAETQDMKQVFEECYAKYPDQIAFKSRIVDTIIEEGLFEWMDLANNKGDQTKFGLMLKKYVGRVLSDIKLKVRNPKARPARWEYVFTKEIEERSLIEFL